MITRAIKRAYDVMSERNWDTIYWAIDLHGTVLKSNYEAGGYEWLDANIPVSLRALNRLPETKIILWSSVHEPDKEGVIAFFKASGIKVDYFNENPEVPNTVTGNFDQKFYFSVLVDDKAGFDPSDWLEAIITAQQLSGEFYRAQDRNS